MHHSRGIGNPFIELPEVDSTNNYAMARISEGPVKEGTAWFAWKQTTGKGQRGKAWQSEPGENILLSVVLKPVVLRPSQQFILSAAIALALHDLGKSYLGNQAKIKWSNDLYCGDKKAGGILIENVIRGNDWNYAVAGIGLNVNQSGFPENLPNPVSLRQATGKRYDVLKMARELCQCIDRRYQALQPGNFNGILAEYTANLYHLRRPRQFRMNDHTFEASIEGVENDGKLLLLKEGEWLRADFGEISFVI